MALHHQRVQQTLLRFPKIAASLPADWLTGQQTQSEIVDAHRVYRWLAAGETGWAGAQLAALEDLLVHVDRWPKIAAKIAEIWKANEDRVDSLATELAVARHLLDTGHSVQSEPPVGRKRPEYLIDGQVMLEVKSFMRRDNEPFARLVQALTEDLDSGAHLQLVGVEGPLKQNHVAPLVRKARHLFSRSRPMPSADVALDHDGVRVSLRVTLADAGVPEGSLISVDGNVPTRDECDHVFRPWARSRLKDARHQMAGHTDRIVVLDISYCRPALDLLWHPDVVQRIVADEAGRHPRLRAVVAYRSGSHFGGINFSPPDALLKLL